MVAGKENPFLKLQKGLYIGRKSEFNYSLVIFVEVKS